MNYNTYDRYSDFRINGNIAFLPFITLADKSTDKTAIYKKGFTRLDILSNYYYNDPNYGWLILLKNPSLASLEFQLEDQASITIPYPLETSVKQYQDAVTEYDQYYGLTDPQ